MYILGLSGLYHDSAAALLKDDEIVAAIQEERFSRLKFDAKFPRLAIQGCLQEAQINIKDLAAVVFYEKPWLKFERILETNFAFAPRGFTQFQHSLPTWWRNKIFLKQTIARELRRMDRGLNASNMPKILFATHHESHAASAFYPSPFESSAVLCVDGVGEWSTTSAWDARDSKITPLWELHFPHSLGLLYSAFTAFAGFRVNSGEYKLMGLAPFGKPRFAGKICDHLIEIRPDGSYRLNMDYFEFPYGMKMTNARFEKLIGIPPRTPEAPLSQEYADLAASIQRVTEEVLLKLVRTVHEDTKHTNLCLAGGVALNCVANSRILKEGPFKNIWVQPAAGDAGGSLGAAYLAWHRHFENERPKPFKDKMKGTYLGPTLTPENIEKSLSELGAIYRELNTETLMTEVAARLNQGDVVGWFQGRMEFGPRALGNRSILGDARDPKMQSTLNLKIKFRESFRPFAPAVLEEDAAAYFTLPRPSPYMLFTAQLSQHLRHSIKPDSVNREPYQRVHEIRSALPAITHVDGSARVQTVCRSENPRFHQLLSEFKKLTGFGVLINTSFNVRGEPIVASPAEAFRCFMTTEMDILVIDNFIMSKSAQKVRVPRGELSLD